ncbi:hypothetical protein NP493_725g00025 [Ridgeia piscesae]|uniref:CUB domain-containing protein n=1 Tax=Ridgeia piscesae TaxID=27915 RepID=A0AAD9NQC9_RIDPI|nr:hypothetical protein NP493_725g00025 [Ridgeia piscesae]
MSPMHLGGSMGVFGTTLDNFTECSWKIQVPNKKIVRLHFLKYTFGNNSTCSSQTINVYNGPDYKAPLLHSFCNDVWPGDLISSGNEVFVYYVRRDPEADAVFRIKYSTDVPSQGCGDEPAVIRGSKGTIEFNEVPFENRMKCGWNIQLYDNRQIWLHFTSFRLEDSTDCITIFDGNDTTAPELRKFCGNDRPGDITCSGNVLFISFFSDGSRVHANFEIRYRAIVQVDGKSHARCKCINST